MQLNGEVWVEQDGYALQKLKLEEVTVPIPAGESTPVVVRMKKVID